MKLITIIKETVIGDNQNQDKLFFEYCDEYSIEHKIINENLETSSYPDIEFKSGPVALSNMLKERFGYTQEEINEEFPQIKEALEEDTANQN
jgi:hypothetical protein